MMAAVSFQWLAQWRSVATKLALFTPPRTLTDRLPSLTTLLDHRTTLAYLCYLGYSSLPSSKDLPTTTALHMTRPRRQDRKTGKCARNVFLVYVLGAAGSGKTSLLRAFVNKPFTETWEATSRVLAVVNGVERGGGEKYLVVSLGRSIVVVVSSDDLSSMPLSYRSLAPSTSRRPSGVPRSSISRMLLFTSTTAATPILSPTSRICGWVEQVPSKIVRLSD